MYDRRQPVFGGIAGGIFLIFLALAFLVHSFFLPLLFVGLAFSVVFGSLASGKSQATYGGIIGGIWMLGLAVLYVFNVWWPGILILAGISAVAGTLLRPLISAQRQQGSFYQPSPYQGGYPPSYQPSDPYHQQSESSAQKYSQPRAYSPQEFPPQQ